MLFAVAMSVLMLIATYFLEISPLIRGNDSYLTFGTGCSQDAFQRYKDGQFPSLLKQDVGWPLRFNSFNVFEECSQTWYPLSSIIDLIVYFWINILIASIYRKIESDEDFVRKPQS